MIYLFSLLVIWNNLLSLSFAKDYLFASFSIVILMCILFSGNQSSADYENYYHLYEVIFNGGAGFQTSQVGLVLLFELSSWFGLNYNQFLIFASFSGMLLLSITINKYSKKTNLVYLLYFIYPFLLDVVQIKHFLAMTIIVFTLSFLLSDKKSAKLKFTLGVLIAATIHYVALIFLPLFFVTKRSLKQVYFIALCGACMLFLADKFLPLDTIMQSFMGNDRVNDYFNNRPSWGFFLPILIQATMLSFIFFARRLLLLKNKNTIYVDLIYKINIYLLILIPLYMINANFERAFRILFVPNFIVLSIFFYESNLRNRWVITGTLLAYVLFLFMTYIYIPNRTSVFEPIFNNNIFFNSFLG
jgi:hypothetical protein